MKPNVWACIASGPSLVPEDIDYCREQGWHLATCNLSFRLVPDADLFYAMDYQWWDRYGVDVMAILSSSCEIWTGNGSTAAKMPWLKRVRFLPGRGWSDTPGKVYSGDPPGSGEHLLQLVGSKEPDLIILLGYDMQHTGGRAHHHEDYPEGMSNAPDVERHINNYEAAAASGVRIINCSRDSALRCFPKIPLRSVPRETERYRIA